MRWLLSPVYSRFDSLWIGLCVLAISDRLWLAAVAIVIFGALISGALNELTKEQAK